MTGSTSRYLRALTGGRRPAGVAASLLADVLPATSPARERRRAASRAVAAAAALLPCALARHGVRRGGDAAAMWDVATKFGRPEDLDAPEIGVRAQLDRSRLDPRLGGLLGDDAEPLSDWLASDSGVPAIELGRCVAAVAPLVLGALVRTAGSAAGLPSALAPFSPGDLERIAMLDTNASQTGRVYATVLSRAHRRAGMGWFLLLFRS